MSFVSEIKFQNSLAGNVNWKFENLSEILFLIWPMYSRWFFVIESITVQLKQKTNAQKYKANLNNE